MWFTHPGETDEAFCGKDLPMKQEQQAEPGPEESEKRERLEPWRPAFEKILFAIRRVQKLEDRS